MQAANAAISPSRSSTHEPPSKPAQNQKSDRSPAPKVDSPRKTSSSARTSSAAASRSATPASRTVYASGGDELIEHLRETGEVGQLAGRRRLVPLPVAVDPDRLQAELAGRDDVVKMALRDVHVAFARHVDLCEEALPVRMPRLVGADLGGDDRELEGNADLLHRRLDEITVGVRQDGELPASGARRFERRTDLRERLPRGQRTGERSSVVDGEPPRNLRHHVAVRAPSVLGLHLRLALVVAREQVVATESAPQPAVPVDQRAVAVKRRPALSRQSA